MSVKNRAGFEADSLNPYKERLEELADLKDGWLDGEGLRADGASLIFARDLSQMLYKDRDFLFGIFPAGDGGVQFEKMIGPDGMITVEIANGGEVSVYGFRYTTDIDSCVIVKSVDECFNAIAEAYAKIVAV